MVTAFEPYIVFPPYTQVKSAPYTVEHFYTSAGEDNSEWLGTNYEKSKDENNRLTKTLKADHYDITMVSLDREKLKTYLNTTNWESKTRFEATGGGHGTMVCKGTMAKTYDNGKIFDGRDNLSGDYIMRGGKMVQVPHGKEYGLKGFRCWFEVNNGSSQAKALRLEIDGISDDATSIDEINSQPSQFTSRHKGISGVFNLDGQKVREGKSTQNLPKGIYIVNGRKVVVM